ncbi:hypothetical protein HDU76_009112 [Blyttiomyces sp. JEL0837]|nr:hypothetical protein HDU76_009112 [Blyttiomyces sp. JEL0837]
MASIDLKMTAEPASVVQNTNNAVPAPANSTTAGGTPPAAPSVTDPTDATAVIVKGDELLAELKTLEAKASAYNTLAAQVFAEETACLKQLKEQRAKIREYLKSSSQTLQLVKEKQKLASPTETTTTTASKSSSSTTRSQSVDYKKNLINSSLSLDELTDDSGSDPLRRSRGSENDLSSASTGLRKRNTYGGSSGSLSSLSMSMGGSMESLKIRSRTPPPGFSRGRGGHGILDDLEDIRAALERRFTRVEMMLPRPAKTVLRWSLGNSAPFTLRPQSHRLQYKKEVEIFKLTFTLFLTVLSTIGLLISPIKYPTISAASDAIFLFASLYYYSTVTLREHILWVNGSRIRTWWFMHHYLSIGLSGVLLVWPGMPPVSTPTTPIGIIPTTNTDEDPYSFYHAFRTQFLLFCTYLGVVQYLQYRYQKRRLYVLVALDRAAPMDIVAGDGAHTDRMGNDFWMLVPFLVVGQCWQLWNGWSCWRIWWRGGADWHILAAAVLFWLLGLGNMIATARTFMSKKAEVRASSSSNISGLHRARARGSGISLTSASTSNLSGRN